MADRPYIKPSPVLSAASMATDLTSDITILAQKTGASYDLVWTGAPVGTFSVEISNSVTQGSDGAITGGNWTPVTLSTAITAAGTADNAFINLAGLEAYAVRLVYTRTSGSGSVTALICSKVQ